MEDEEVFSSIWRLKLHTNISFFPRRVILLKELHFQEGIASDAIPSTPTGGPSIGRTLRAKGQLSMKSNTRICNDHDAEESYNGRLGPRSAQ